MARCDSLSSRLPRDKDASLGALQGATEGGADGGSDGKKPARGKRRNTKGMSNRTSEGRNKRELVKWGRKGNERKGIREGREKEESSKTRQ